MKNYFEKMDSGAVRLICVYAAEAVICLLAVVMFLRADAGGSGYTGTTVNTGSAADTWNLLAFPWAQIGMMLRRLSVSGAAGNVLAWILYTLISLIPAAVWMGIRRGKREKKADLFLPLFSLLLFGLLYLAVNPAFLFRLTGASAAQTTSSVLLASCALAADSLLILYLVVRLLHSWKNMESRKLIRNLRYFFYLFGFVMVILVFAGGPADFMSALQKVQEGNTADVGATTRFLLAMKTLASCLPDAAQLLLSVLAVSLLGAMEEDIYGEKTVHNAELLARVCGISLVVNLSFLVCCNVLNLMLQSGSSDSSFTAGIPLGYIGFSLILTLITRSLSSGRDLKQDYDLFI
ncbi:MAG: hypothetical protein ACI4D3_07850 [Lachnospiraceae bacterium]